MRDEKKEKHLYTSSIFYVKEKRQVSNIPKLQKQFYLNPN